MNEKIYYSAEDIAKMLGVSMGKAYKILREMNKDLASKGFLTIAGKIPLEYFKEEWYVHFMLQQSSDPTMTLTDFWEIYKADMEKRLRKTTMKQKEYVMNDKILPYFGKTPINEITAPMIRKSPIRNLLLQEISGAGIYFCKPEPRIPIQLFCCLK